MLSDTSDYSSPIRKRKQTTKIVLQSSDEETPIKKTKALKHRKSSDEEETPIKNTKPSKHRKLQSSDSSSDERDQRNRYISSDDDIPVKSRRGARHFRVSSSSDSSDSIIAGPSHKKCRVILDSETENSASTDSEVDQVFRPWSSKNNTSNKIGNDKDSSKLSRKMNRLSEDESTNSSDNDGAERCIICFKTLRAPIAHPSNCSHNFHSECLATWSKTSNTCPIDRVKYTEILITDINGDLISKYNVITPPPQDHNADFEPDDTTLMAELCEICGQPDREHEMLLCDRCEAGYHLDCLTPPLQEVPTEDWYCPDCEDLVNGVHIVDDDDDVQSDYQLRDRPPRRIRVPRGPRTRAAQRVFNLIHHQSIINQPSTSRSSSSRPRTTQRRKSSKRNRKTQYKVEFITVEDGSTLEVKVAVNTHRVKRVKQKLKKVKKKSCHGKSSRVSGNNGNVSRGTSFSSNSLDLFGMRPQLDYFSGCEAEDELDEEGGSSGGVAFLRRARPSLRNMANRKQLAAQILNARPRRPIPRIATPTTPIDIVSSILEEQNKWHNPNAIIHGTTEGDVRVLLNEQKSLPVRKAAGGNTGESSGRNVTQTHSQHSSVNQSYSETSNSSALPPLQPPPQPPAKLCEDDDFDLYADIETTPSCKLAPPPEPPAMLLAMEEDGGGSSPEDTMLIIDDERQPYDPDMPTSPPVSPSKEGSGEQNKESVERVNMIDRDTENKNDEYPPINSNLEHIRLPSPEGEMDSDCPNRFIYSKVSTEIAKGSHSDSDVSDKEDTIPPQDNDFELKNADNNLEDAQQNMKPDGKPKRKSSGVMQRENEEECEDDDHIPHIPLPKDNELELKEKASIEFASEDENSLEKETEENESVKDDTLNEEEFNLFKNGLEEEETLEKLSLKEDGLGKEDQELLEEGEKSVKSSKEDFEHSDGELCELNQSDEVHENCIDKGITKDNQDNVNGSLESLNGEEKLESNKMNNTSKSSGNDTEKDNDADAENDVLELGCEDDRDGLVDITDEEISTYERNWELEDIQVPSEKTIGLEGLETEAISDCEYTLAEERQSVPKTQTENGPKEEGEIVLEDRVSPVTWKKLSKGTKERSYREKEIGKEKPPKKEKKKTKEKRKEIERYDVRKIISEKPKKRKVDEFGRDISSRSRSRSKSRSRRSTSRTKRVDKRSLEKRSRGLSRNRSRGRSRERSKRRSRGRSRSNSKSRSTSKRPRSRSPRKIKGRNSRAKSKDRKKRRKSSISCSSCSCSSCEREKRRTNKKLNLSRNKNSSTTAKDKRRGKYKDNKNTSPKRRRLNSPIPSKEVFTSGDNILVSVNFKSSKTSDSRNKDSGKRKRDDDSKKKKDKSAKENQPLRSIVTAKSGTFNQRRLNTRNLKPVAIIDLDQSPFREQTPSPKEIIILTDSDSDEKIKEPDKPLPAIITGPKTPPEPHIKFNIINSKPQIRILSNPLLDSGDQNEDDEADDEPNDIIHKGPNTPPEPPVPYDPFEPTKSRSPTPIQDAESDRNPSPPQEINLCTRITPEPTRALTPPKITQHESPKTPSPLHSPPKPMEEINADKPKQPAFAATAMDNDDSMDIGGGGDSPYSPGSSEGDDLFEPPLPQITTPTLIGKVKPRAGLNKHNPKLTPSPLKKKNKTISNKTSKGNNSKKEIGIKLDEDQLKILDELPNSAVEMQVKDKFLKKLNRQERVVEEVKMVLKPHYAKKHVSKEEYKDILRKSVPKICHSKSGEINPMKIQRLIEAYVKKYRHKKKRKPIPSIAPLQALKQKTKQSMWC